jgi:hypothetical protein
MTEIFEKSAVISPFPGLTLFPLSSVPADSPIYSEVSSLASSLQELQNRSDFSAIVSQVNDLDASLNRAVDLLEGARQEGYVYQGDLEQIAYNAISQWQSARPQVVASLQQQAAGMQGQLYSINSMLQSLNASLPYPSTAGPLLQNARSAVASLLDHISQVENSLRSIYSEIETRVQALNARLTDIHWAMDQLNGAKFKFSPGEALVMAVAARWDKEGKDDPEGVLYLSSQRLVFERKEKVATKKILFITTASQLVQEVLIDQPLAKLGEVSPDNRGLFGHQDFLLAQFADPGLGLVAFHINGQDSKDWAGLVEKTRSGRIEAERLNISSGLSIADLSRPLTAADLVGLQSQVNALQDEMMLKASRQEIGNLENDVSALSRKLAALRARGYAVEKALEADIAILAAQWERVKTNAETTIETQTRLLADQMVPIRETLARLVGMSGDLTAARPLYMQLTSVLASASAQADAARSTVVAQYGSYAREVDSLSAHLDQVGWMLDTLSTASFRLLATESAVAAVGALFQHPTWVPEDGVLFLTDQRLLWEDRAKDYQLKFDIPLQAVLAVSSTADVQKTLGPQEPREVLAVRFGAQAPVADGCFQLALPVAEQWVKMIGRARSGDYSQDRAVSLSPEELERVRNAPQQCSKCGAAFSAPLLRGQTEIRCEYCGLVTRL